MEIENVTIIPIDAWEHALFCHLRSVACVRLRWCSLSFAQLYILMLSKGVFTPDSVKCTVSESEPSTCFLYPSYSRAVKVLGWSHDFSQKSKGNKLFTLIGTPGWVKWAGGDVGVFLGEGCSL